MKTDIERAREIAARDNKRAALTKAQSIMCMRSAGRANRHVQLPESKRVLRHGCLGEGCARRRDMRLNPLDPIDPLSPLPPDNGTPPTRSLVIWSIIGIAVLAIATIALLRIV